MTRRGIRGLYIASTILSIAGSVLFVIGAMSEVDELGESDEKKKDEEDE